MALTYLGTLDDRIEIYPWGYKPDMEFLNRTLVRSVLFGERLLINDGYLISLSACREALMDKEKSPLWMLIENGYVRILSRTGDLATLPEDMEKVGVKTHADIRGRDEWPDLKVSLRRMTDTLQERDLLYRWPRQDMGAGFVQTVWKAEGRTPEQLGLRHVGEDLLKRVFDDFRRAMEQDYLAARTRWERVCKEAVASSGAGKQALQELMHLGNASYHANFAGCLSISLGEPVLAETRFHPGLADLYDMSEVDSKRDGYIADFLPAALPPEFPLCDSYLLEEVLDESGALGRARRDYLDYLQKWHSESSCDVSILRAASKDYARRLTRHFYKDADLNRWRLKGAIASGAIITLFTANTHSTMMEQIWAKLMLSALGSTLPFVITGMMKTRTPGRSFFGSDTGRPAHGDGRHPFIVSLPVNQNAIDTIYSKLPEHS